MAYVFNFCEFLIIRLYNIKDSIHFYKSIRVIAEYNIYIKEKLYSNTNIHTLTYTLYSTFNLTDTMFRIKYEQHCAQLLGLRDKYNKFNRCE